MVVIGPEHVRIGRNAVVVYCHLEGHTDVQLGVRHRGGPGGASGRIRVQDIRSAGQHDAVWGVPVSRLGHAGVAYFCLVAVRRPADAGHWGRSSVRYHTVVRWRDSWTPNERFVLKVLFNIYIFFFFLQKSCSEKLIFDSMFINAIDMDNRIAGHN